MNEGINKRTGMQASHVWEHLPRTGVEKQKNLKVLIFKIEFEFELNLQILEL